MLLLIFNDSNRPGGAQYCKVDDETQIFDHNLTIAAISAIGVASKLYKPWFVAVGFKKPHAPWGVYVTATSSSVKILIRHSPFYFKMYYDYICGYDYGYTYDV